MDLLNNYIHLMSYINTFIKVSEDCPVMQSEIPADKPDKKPAHLIQYELLTQKPYTYDHEGLIYEVYIRQKDFLSRYQNRMLNRSKQSCFQKASLVCGRRFWLNAMVLAPIIMKRVRLPFTRWNQRYTCGLLTMQVYKS